MNPTENPFATKVELAYKAVEMHHVDQEFVDKYDFSQHGCIETILINGDDVRTLRIPDGVKFVYCSKIGLRSIYLPDSVLLLVCNDNYLSHLDLPGNIDVVEANNNFITGITFRDTPTNLSILELKKNRLLSLDFPVPTCMCKILIDENPLLRDHRISLDVRRFINAQMMVPPSFMDN